MNQDQNTPKEQYHYEHQIASIMYDNYGISFENFTKLVHTQFDNVPQNDINNVYERINADKIYCIVDTDNFNSDYPNESFLGWIDSKNMFYTYYFYTKEKAESVANTLNQLDPNTNSPRFYKVVEKNYKLSGGFEP